ncbi:hypothetical protein CLOSTHATH_03462 [Hungatella hathewayi DSM 13479]|uniref:Uncharacterized protein n=1 Tax=Hungatella hathewayi DSM 13479 TaxID=566550 RepID=D3AIM2_9FIRM|nr:hypothetical protein CLOSTHATH_03462 [Hungatella hathewayi DSM 13479]
MNTWEASAAMFASLFMTRASGQVCFNKSVSDDLTLYIVLSSAWFCLRMNNW